MPVWEYTSNVQLSEFALKLREYRLKNKLNPSTASTQLGISDDRLFALEVDNTKPTSIEKWRFKRLLAKQKTASSK